jgi:hypothetical protein
MQNKNKRSIAKKLQTPEFKSEAEEARWYEKNQDSLLAEFKDAAKDGTLGARLPCEAWLDANHHNTAGQT